MHTYGLRDCDYVYMNSVFIYVPFGVLHASSRFCGLCVFFMLLYNLCVRALCVSACVWMVYRCAPNPRQWVRAWSEGALKPHRAQVSCLHG